MLSLYNGCKGERGQAVAELAVTMFVLVLLLFSLLELGLILNAKLVLSSSAREVARVCAVTGGWTEQAQPLIDSVLEASGLPTGSIRIDISPRQAIYGTVISVRLTHDYRVRTAIVTILADPIITLNAEAVTRSEFVPR